MAYDNLTLTSLIQAYQADIPSGEINFQPIATGKFNTSFLVQAGEQSFVLRIAPPRDAVFVFYERLMMQQEPELHEVVQRHTSTPVPRILIFDDSLKLLDRDYMIMEHLPGRPLTEMRQIDENKVFKQVGAYLAEVHKIRREQYGYLGAHKPMQPQDTWLEAFTIMWNRMIDDIVEVGHYNPQEETSMRRLFDNHCKYFSHPVSSCLLHMDIWHQNILVDQRGQVTGILDWDRALWGDPEIEFAVLDYCGVSTPAFWEGYGKPRDRTPAARIRQVFYLLYELQKYIVIRQGRGNDHIGAQGYKQQVFQIVNSSLAQ